MYNAQDYIKQSVDELNASSEESAKSQIKNIIQNIVKEQKIILEANLRIKKLQEELRSINVVEIAVADLGF